MQKPEVREKTDSNFLFQKKAHNLGNTDRIFKIFFRLSLSLIEICVGHIGSYVATILDIYVCHVQMKGHKIGSA